MSYPRFLLASASPRRRELLRLLNVPFEVLATDVDETPAPGETATSLVRRLSRLKAQAAQSQRPGTTIIAADTVVELDGAILGKPRDEEQAREMLRLLRGRAHLVHGGITILDPTLPLPKSKTSRGPNHETSAPRRTTEGLRVAAAPDQKEGANRRDGTGGEATLGVRTSVWMRDYSDAEIEAYVTTGDPLDKAAAYGVQDRAFQPVARVEGCFANVMGLAVCQLRNALAQYYSLPEPCLECHLSPDGGCTVARLVAA